jgi:hypothetical protein
MELNKILKVSNGFEKYLFRFATLLFVSMVMFWMVILFYPFNPAEFHGVELNEKQVSAGDGITFNVIFDKYTTLVPEITRYLVSCDAPQKGTITLETTVGEAKVGMKVKPVSTEIPRHTYPGRWKIGILIRYPYFGGLNKVDRWTESECFQVQPYDLRKDVKARSVEADLIVADKVKALSAEVKKIKALEAEIIQLKASKVEKQEEVK